MSIFTVRSLMQILCMLVIIVLNKMLPPTYAEKWPLSPSASPASVIFQLQDLQHNNDNYASIQEEQLNKLKDVEKSQSQTEQEYQDYGFWDPAPYFGGGDPAPVPHGRTINQRSKKQTDLKTVIRL
ncbi:hypothetical protein A4A49_13359 [Nicotiana attenuata]|uniref:Uncharacterized protein n=1 Tax=Nicotiana attenuata TaxID=49451 RepID=A0A314KT11_NICAT|nr:hypothetical protein A4A49_13359 [Nicotiana attenuata]